MSKRAAIRREQKKREKMLKDPVSRLALEGKEDGQILAVCTVGTALHECFGFGRVRFHRLMTDVWNESKKYNNDGFKYVLGSYIDRINKKMLTIKIEKQQIEARKAVYISSRLESFVGCVAMMFLSLNNLYGYSFNDKHSGRLDILLEYVCNSFIKASFDTSRELVQRLKKKCEKAMRLEVEI